MRSMPKVPVVILGSLMLIGLLFAVYFGVAGGM